MVSNTRARSLVFMALLVSAVTLTLVSVIYRHVVVPGVWNRWTQRPRDNGGALRLEFNNTVFRVGEEIVLRCLFSNTTDRVLYVQTKRPHSFLAGVFLIVDYHHNCELYAPHGIDTGGIDMDFYSKVRPHDEILLFRVAAVAGHALASRAEWFEMGSTEMLPLPFSHSCEYRLHATYWDRKPSHRKAVRGRLTDRASITIMRDETSTTERTTR